MEAFNNNDIVHLSNDLQCTGSHSNAQLLNVLKGRCIQLYIYIMHKRNIKLEHPKLQNKEADNCDHLTDDLLHLTENYDIKIPNSKLAYTSLCIYITMDI